MSFLILGVIFFITGTFAVKPELDSQWESFKANFDKKYDSEEDARRRSIWEEKFDRQQKRLLGAGNGNMPLILVINSMADIDMDEYRKSEKEPEKNASVGQFSPEMIPKDR